jgi:hypothetical protein
MNSHDRRNAKRYVIDGLMAEVNGVVHETFDVSLYAVAVLRRAGVDYSKFVGPLMFRSERSVELNQTVCRVHFIKQRAGLVVLGYDANATEWEATLARYDVRADMVQLEDIFG